MRPILDTSNEHYMLQHLAAGLGDMVAEALTIDDLIAWCTHSAEKANKVIVRRSIDLVLITLAIGTFGAAASADAQVPRDFFVKLARGPCEGSCPAYSVTVDSKGNVQWDGRYFVWQKGSAKKVISQSDLQLIVRKVEGMKFFGFESGGRQCLDTPDIFIEITVNQRTKSVTHDSCSQAKTSEGRQIAELARYLEEMIGTDQWVGPKRLASAS